MGWGYALAAANTCLRPPRLHACKQSFSVLVSSDHPKRACIAKGVTSSVATWLQVLHQQQHCQSARPFLNLCSGVLEQADILDGRGITPSQLVVVQPGSRGCSCSNMGNNSSASHVASRVLHEQHIQMCSSYKVPDHTSVPAYQLVGIFRAMLGHPALPHGAKSFSLEAKWGLLHLLLLQAAAERQRYEEKLQHLLDRVLLHHAANKLAQVLVNPHVPQVNKHLAEQRYQQLYNSCSSIVETWVTATCQGDMFKLLQPVMQGVAGVMESSVAAGIHQLTPHTRTGGKMMEASALQVLEASLPAGWSLIPSLHLLGTDGEPFQVEQGCKYEADMLVLDEQGVAVAVVEVKLAAANPLMSLFNDVNALLNIVDRISGKTVTGITKSEVSGAAAASTAAVVAAAAADGSDVQGSVLAKARAATYTAPFTEQTWREVHVKVDTDVTPLYILGRQIEEADVVRGLASMVDSSALKLLASSASTCAQALAPAAILQQQERSDQCIDSNQRLIEQNAADLHAGAAGDSALQRAHASGSSSASSGTSTESSDSRACYRVLVNLDQDMQDAIAAQISNRMDVLQRCKIYSLGCESQLLVDASGQSVGMRQAQVNVGIDV